MILTSFTFIYIVSFSDKNLFLRLPNYFLCFLIFFLFFPIETTFHGLNSVKKIGCFVVVKHEHFHEISCYTEVTDFLKLHQLIRFLLVL